MNLWWTQGQLVLVPDLISHFVVGLLVGWYVTQYVHHEVSFLGFPPAHPSTTTITVYLACWFLQHCFFWNTWLNNFVQHFPCLSPHILGSFASGLVYSYVIAFLFLLWYVKTFFLSYDKKVGQFYHRYSFWLVLGMGRMYKSQKLPARRLFQQHSILFYLLWHTHKWTLNKSKNEQSPRKRKDAQCKDSGEIIKLLQWQ